MTCNAGGQRQSEDPDPSVLVWLKMLSELMADLPTDHPGNTVAAIAIRTHLFDEETSTSPIGPRRGEPEPRKRGRNNAVVARFCGSRTSMNSVSQLRATMACYEEAPEEVPKQVLDQAELCPDRIKSTPPVPPGGRAL